MKRVLLLGVLAALFAGQASAATYEMDRDTAALLRAITWSDPGFGNELYYIGYDPGVAPADWIWGPSPNYGADMEYAVGFYGHLNILGTADALASVNIGLNGAKALSGTYDSFVLPIANDDQQIWEYKLYVNTTGTDYASAGWTSLAGGTQASLDLPLGAGVDFSTLEDIGFVVQFNKATTGGGTTISDDFHTSVVPVPGAVLLGLLGLAAAGVKLRRIA